MSGTCKGKIRALCRINQMSHVKKMLQNGILAVFLSIAPLHGHADGHGLAMHGQPELSTNFTHLPYANPDAPKGGEIVFGEVEGGHVA